MFHSIAVASFFFNFLFQRYSTFVGIIICGLAIITMLTLPMSSQPWSCSIWVKNASDYEFALGKAAKEFWFSLDMKFCNNNYDETNLLSHNYLTKLKWVNSKTKSQICKNNQRNILIDIFFMNVIFNYRWLHLLWIIPSEISKYLSRYI